LDGDDPLVTLDAEEEGVPVLEQDERQPKRPTTFTDYKKNRDSTKVVKQVITQIMIWTYIISTMVMGIQQFPTIQYYWDTSTSGLQYGNPMIRSLLSRDKWRLVHRCFHYDHNWLQTKLNELLRKYRRPFKNVSVDESMAAFRGRVIFLQYLPLKPIKYGLKHFVLSDTHGYTYSFWLYRGSASPFATDTVSVVLNHLATLPTDKIFYLGVDNYYSSLQLAEKIVEKYPNIRFIGTVRQNRPNWLWKPISDEAEQKTKQVKKSDTNNRAFSFRTNEEKTICAVSLHDNKMVNFITNINTPHTNNQKKQVLNIQNFYNKTMQGVDISDRKIMEYYPFPHRKSRWPRAEFFYLMKMMMLNVFLLQQSESTDARFSQLDFIESIVISTLKDQARTTTISPDHQCVSAPKNTHCAYCKKAKSSVRHKCNTCNKYLHKKCFDEYHIKQQIKIV
jgi:hypothetical protein